jgi:hypothetical protein
MSSTGNAFGDADDHLDAGIRRFEDGIGRERRRHVDHRGVGAGFAHGIVHGVEHRQADVRAAALARGHAADQFGAVFEHLLGMEGALLAGEALGDDLGVLVDQNAHGSILKMLALRVGAPSGAIRESLQARIAKRIAPEGAPTGKCGFRPP